MRVTKSYNNDNNNDNDEDDNQTRHFGDNEAAVAAAAAAAGGRCTHVMHDRSRIAIDPRIPSMPGRSTLGFHQSGRHCLHQTPSAVRCWSSRMKDE